MKTRYIYKPLEYTGNRVVHICILYSLSLYLFLCQPVMLCGARNPDRHVRRVSPTKVSQIHEGPILDVVWMSERATFRGAVTVKIQ